MWSIRQRRRTIRLLSLALVIAFGAVNRSAAQTPDPRGGPLEIEDALQTASFPRHTPIVLSRNGELVAYTVRRPTRWLEGAKEERFSEYSPTGVFIEGTACDVWVADTRNGQTTNLTNGRGSNWAPAWSPDGQQLAFYSDRAGTAQLWIWQRSSGQLREASAAIVRPHWTFEVPRWSPDGTLIAFKALPEDLTLASAAALIVEGGSRDSDSPSARGPLGKPTVREYRSLPAPAAPSAREQPQDPRSGQLEVGAFFNIYLADLAVVDARARRGDSSNE